MVNAAGPFVLETAVSSVIFINNKADNVPNIEHIQTTLNLFYVKTLDKIQVVLKHRNLEILTCRNAPYEFLDKLNINSVTCCLTTRLLRDTYSYLSFGVISSV